MPDPVAVGPLAVEDMDGVEVLLEDHVNIELEVVELFLDGLLVEFMVIFEAKGIEAHGEEAQNNECQRFHFVKLKNI